MKNLSAFYAPQSHIHVIARGLLMYKDMCILCRAKGSQSFFFPGGHIEDGESAHTALIRELGEELGKNEYKISDFLGVCENVFPFKENLLQHEINLVFKVEVGENFTLISKEDHLEFTSIKIQDLKNYTILPVSLKEGVLEWLENKTMFFQEV